MSTNPLQNLTPRQIVAELDQYIIGQADAKRAVAVAIRNRWRRQQLPEAMRSDVIPKNILMVGPTGVGKTEIARRLANLTGAPFLKVEATKYTEVGYHGRDVESMMRDLVEVAIAMVRAEMAQHVQARAAEQAQERLLDALLPGSSGELDPPDAQGRHTSTREKLRAQLVAGKLEDHTIEISFEEKPNVMGMLGSAGLELDPQMQGMFERMVPARREMRRLRVADARRTLLAMEGDKLLDKSVLTGDAIERAEQSGIIFLDEIDKIAAPDKPGGGPDVSRSGVQRDLLPLVEGSTVMTKYGPVRSDHVLFIAAGAFHACAPGDLIPELQGRFPIRVELADLTKDDLVRILKEPRHALIRQQVELLATEGVQIQFTDDAIESIAYAAHDLNRRGQNIGARRLHTILERVLEPISFDAADANKTQVTIDGAFVRARLKGRKGDDWSLL